MKGKGMIGALLLGASLMVGGVASAGFIQGTHVKTDMPRSVFYNDVARWWDVVYM